MHRINTHNKEEFEVFDIYEDLESIENRKRILESKKSRFPMLSSVWIQTAPLFRSPYLFSTILVCTVQFGIYFTCNGFYMFFADILNRMASNLDNFTEPRLSMCEIINMKSINRTSFQHNDNNATTLPDQVSLCVIRIFFVISIITQKWYRLDLYYQTRAPNS